MQNNLTSFQLKTLMTLTKSQHCRQADVGRDLWKPSDLTLLLKQGHLQMVAPSHIWTAFYCLQGWTSASLGSLWQCLVTLTVKNCFLIFRRKLLCVLHSLNHVCGPELSTIHPSLLLRRTEPDAALQVWPHHCWTDGQHHLPQPAGSTGNSSCSPAYHQPSLQQGHIADSQPTWCWPGPPAAFQPPSMCWCLGLLFPRSRTLHFPCWTKLSRDTSTLVNWICTLRFIKLCHSPTPHFYTFPITPRCLELSSAPQNHDGLQSFTC